MENMQLAWECPCGQGAPYDTCCGRLHRGAEADGPLQLMRARYAAYALGDFGYLFRTWHPRTRPENLTGRMRMEWIGLEVISSYTSSDIQSGFVEFVARFRSPFGPGVLHERSQFLRRAGLWTYLNGEDLSNIPAPRPPAQVPALVPAS